MSLLDLLPLLTYFVHSQNSLRTLLLSVTTADATLLPSALDPMDPVTAVGIVASILQLVAAAKSVIDLGKDAVNAPKEQRALFHEVENLEPLLADLQRRLQLPGSQSINGLQPLKAPLLDFKETMERVDQRLRSANEAGSKIPKALSWTLWNKNEAEDDLAKIERFKTLLNAWLGLDVWDQQQRHHERIEQMFTDIGSTQRLDHYRLLTEVRNVAQNQQDLQDSAEHEKIVKEREKIAKEHEKIIDWLSPPNFFARQADIFGTRQNGTGLWFLDEKQFQDWLSSSGNTLWCHGIPGAGKTVIMSIVVDYLRNHFQNNNIGVAVAYLNHKESDTQSPSNILAGLWWQLVSERPIPALVRQLYEKHHNQRTKPSLDEVRNIFHSTVAEYLKVFIVVDALDEYPASQRHILLDALAAMAQNTCMIVTSRPHIFPESLLRDPHTLEIRSREDDIRSYVKAQIHSPGSYLSKHVKTCPGLEEEIDTKIVGTVKGMFLLAKLHMDSLTTKLSVKAVREALKSLSGDLEHTYDEAMARIESQNKDQKDIAWRALMWVVNAKRPLTVFELQEALAIEPDSKVVSLDTRFRSSNSFLVNSKALDADGLFDIKIILSVCVGLVIVDSSSRWSRFSPGFRIVRLAHFTIQEYLDRAQPTRFPGAQTEITRNCLTYISYHDVGNFELAWWKHPNRFLPYAFAYCLLHAVGEPEIPLQDSIIQFLEDAHQWQPHHRRYEEPSQWQDAYWRIAYWSSVPSKLWVAALFGLQEVVRHLLETATSISEQEMTNSLTVAARWNCMGVVQLLMKHGANGNAPRPFISNALQALSAGHTDAVRLLLEHGADVNSQGGGFGTALQAASAMKTERIVQLLLEHGADVNLRGGYYGTALQAASVMGTERVVQLLLEHGADQVKGEEGHGVVQLLLENGADVNTQGGYYKTALQAALWKGSMKVVQLLLEHGADLQGRYYGTLLQTALVKGEEGYSVVQLLLEKGADVNALRGYYETALQAASRSGNMEVVQLLLKHGANVNLRGRDFGTALQAASWKGSMEVVQLLLEHGAEVNMQGGYYGTALQAASRKRNMGVVQLLLKHGAENM
ncbi:ankyrin repeat-containing domain protein [Mycena rebaudengoi]|nr:ankyrin repeat-containing domain protein [Mycena rebaudengoi]